MMVIRYCLNLPYYLIIELVGFLYTSDLEKVRKLKLEHRKANAHHTCVVFACVGIGTMFKIAPVC